MTYLCVPIFVSDVSQAQRDIAQAVEAGADIVELRIDGIEDATVVQSIVGGFDVPFILTCRPTWEGGSSELPDEQRVSMLASIAPTDDSTRLDIEKRTLDRV